MSSLRLEEIRNAVLEALEQRLRVLDMAVDTIDPNFNLFDSGVLDSLGFVDLLVHVEQMLGQPIDLADLDFVNLQTLDDLVSQLHELQVREKVDSDD